jgi:preprotein translocase subunit SecD
MRRGTILQLLFIILLAVGASYAVFWPNNQTILGYKIPNPFTFHEGLDLQGGVRVLLVPSDTSKIPSDSDMITVRNQIEKRVNGGLGVNEPVIRNQVNNGIPSISVELPGLSGDQQSATANLFKAGKLEIWNTDSAGSSLQQGAAFNPADYATYNNGSKEPLFTGKDLDINSLAVKQDSSTGEYLVTFTMQGAAYEKLSSFTASHVGKYMTITLDRVVVSSPVIQSQLPGGGQISGSFTQKSATEFKDLLRYGALQVPLKIESQDTIGPTLGADSIQKSLLAGGIGVGIVILYMLLYYRLPGLLADIALILYTLMTLAIFKVLSITMTLAGIAGFVLSIGMAVDANVLIFERVKEEIREGRLLSAAIDIGWKRAWPSIRDSNMATMITCAVLYGFGTNFGATIIVGFATTLFLGVVISMFTAIVVTRTLLNLLVPTGVINHPALFGISKKELPSTSLARRNGAA